MASRLAIFGGLAACALVLGGCSGSDHGHVKGTVKINGKAVEGARVRFAPTEGRTAWGVTDANGAYELSYTPGIMGAKTGTNTVFLSTAKEAEVDDNGKVKTRAVPERFPPDYNEKSTQKVEVKPGENVFDFDVKSGK